MNNLYTKTQQFIDNIHQKGFFHLLSANFLIQLVAFASQLIVAGILSPDDVGRIKIIQTYLSIISIVAGMGFNASTLKLCSENRSKEEQHNLFRSALIFTLVSTVFIYIAVLILNAFGLFSPDKMIQWLIPLGLFPIVSNSLFVVFTAYFQAIRQIKVLSKLTISNKLVSIAGIVLLTYWFGVKGYYVAYNLSFLLMLVVCFRLIKSIQHPTSHNLKNHFPIHWQYAKSSIFANLISEIASYVDILLINLLITDMKQIGYYSFALTMTVALRIFPGTVQQIATPYFSSFSHDRDNFIKTFKRYNKILYTVVALSLIGACLLVPPFVHFVFSGKYDLSVNYFLILSVGWSIRQLTQLQSGAIFGLGKIRFNAFANLYAVVFNVIIITIAIHYYGLTGAAIASIPTNLILVFFSRFYLKKAMQDI